MIRSFIRLFGEQSRTPVTKEDAGLSRVSDSAKHTSGDAYFDTMGRLQTAVTERNYTEAAALVRENLRYLPAWVQECSRDYGSFDIQSIPALEQGGTVLALVADDDGLARMRELVQKTPALHPWAEHLERHEKDRRLFPAIIEAVHENPNCLQTDVKSLVHEADGRRIARLISYLEKAGKLARVKSGRTYKLLPPDSRSIPDRPRRIIESHRAERVSCPPQVLDLSSLDYVPLPRAPLRWEEVHAGREKVTVAKPTAPFAIRDANWQITEVEAIPLAQRPDTAFRRLYPTNSGLFVIDDLGNAEGLGQIEAAALRYDQAGRLAVKKSLNHGVYRVGVHAMGHGLVAMSKDCILHAYDDELRPFLETALADAPEITVLRDRFEVTTLGELKNRIRSVALSQQATRYIFTAVDEAWCVDVRGNRLWGVRLPFKEGWEGVAARGEERGTSDDVDRALALMDLTLPLDPQTLKQRYRQLAKRWHPDLNLGDPTADEKMKELTVAAGLLTGLEANALSEYTGARAFREVGRSEVEVEGARVTVTVGIEVGESQAADWIYAASFAAESDDAYVAGYSGRVVKITKDGQGQRVYDIGSVPERIVDTGDYLYLLTNTRLYVLRNDTLHALVDVFDGGELLVAQTGFGLIEKNRFRWFREDGLFMGSIISKDPIRRAYCTETAMVVETRQRRATVQGVPSWWD